MRIISWIHALLETCLRALAVPVEDASEPRWAESARISLDEEGGAVPGRAGDGRTFDDTLLVDSNGLSKREALIRCGDDYARGTQ
jgi:hypothetical protein